MRRGPALLLLATLVAMSCDEFRGAFPGDHARDIYFTNRADVPVVLYERVAEKTYSHHRVAPGATFHNQILVPPGDLSKSTSRRRFEAKTETEEVIFCRTFTYPDLDGLGWRVTIDRTQACG